MSFDRLIAKIIETKNPTVVGLDPKLDYVPEYIKNKYFEEYGFTLKAAQRQYLNLIKILLMKFAILFRLLNRRQLIMKCMVTMV